MLHSVAITVAMIVDTDGRMISDEGHLRCLDAVLPTQRAVVSSALFDFLDRSIPIYQLQC